MKRIIPIRPDAPFDEVADSAGDVLGVIQDAENALEDGLDSGDAVVALLQVDVVREIVSDAPEAFGQLKQVNDSTARQAVLEAGTRIATNGKPVGPITRFAINSLWSATTGFGSTLQVLEIVQGQVDEKKALLAGEDVFPPFLEISAA